MNRFLALLSLAGFSASATDIPLHLPPPNATPPATDKPVKVYILAGQSNMVGIGQVTGGGSRWGSEFTDPVVSVYSGAYDPKADYDTLTPTTTLSLPSFGGVKPTPYPGGGTHVVRGFFEAKATGVYEFRPGYGGSTHNLMAVDGKEVHRKEVDKISIHNPIKLEAGKKVPFEITYLTGQANGLGWIARVDIPGTLSTEVRQHGKFSHLVDGDGNWVARQDVHYRGVVTATAKKPLAPGCGAGNNNIGPELGFGHVMGFYHDEPVLLIKASQGNRSLGWDFLPPGSKQFEHEGKVYAGDKQSPNSWDKGTEPKPINWYAGKQYDDCFNAAHEVLKNFATEYPQWKDQGYEISGFVWWQGHKDGDGIHAERYEQNLVQLIKTLRSEFKAPNAPFVVGTIGFEGWKMEGAHVTVAEAQLAVSGDKGKYPEFKGNVACVGTKDFFRSQEESPSGQAYHWNSNAETYYLIGEAMGSAMLRLVARNPAGFP